MPIYVYQCRICGQEYTAERSIEHRNDIFCPQCGAGASDQEIQLQPTMCRMIEQPTLTTERQTIAEQGPDWRETPGSRRMANDEPKNLYSLPGDVTRRHSKARK
jgi:putative FmdB family regulatory protein